MALVRSRRPGGGWQRPLNFVRYGVLARVTQFPSHEHDEGTIEEVAREPDYREHEHDDRDADDRREYKCEYDCQREIRAVIEEPDDNDNE